MNDLPLVVFGLLGPVLDRGEGLVHITTGTHVAQICLFLLTESRRFPACLIQTSPPEPRRKELGKYSIIDLDLSKYDRIATRFQEQRKDDLNFLKAGIATRNRAFNDHQGAERPNHGAQNWRVAGRTT